MRCRERYSDYTYCGGYPSGKNTSIVINYQGYLEMRINDIAKWRAPNPLVPTDNFYIKFVFNTLGMEANNIRWIYEPKNDADISERLDVELFYNNIDSSDSKFSMPEVGQLAKIRGDDGWNADATSVLVLTNNSNVMGAQFIPSITKDVAIGLSNCNPSFAFDTMDYSIYSDGSGSYRIYEKGVRRFPEIGDYNNGDVLSIVINENRIIEYRLNNAVQYTSNVSIVFPLFADISMHNEGEILKNISWVPSTYSIPAPPYAPPSAPGVPSAPPVPPYTPPSAPPSGDVWLSKLDCIKQYNTNMTVDGWVVKVAGNMYFWS